MQNTSVGEWGHLTAIELSQLVAKLESELDSAKKELQKRRKGKQSYARRDDRKRSILQILGDGRIRTTSQIAKELGISASGHLRNIICELYSANELYGYAENTVCSHPVFYWYVKAAVSNPVALPAWLDEGAPVPCGETFPI